MLLIACSNDNDPVNDEDDEEIVIDEDFTTNTKDTTFVDAVTIAYTDNIVTITNPYENEGVSITQSNGNVVVTSTNTTTEINYVLSGTIKSGSFKIYSDTNSG